LKTIENDYRCLLYSHKKKTGKDTTRMSSTLIDRSDVSHMFNIERIFVSSSIYESDSR